MTDGPAADVIVVGGGLIGSAIAWQLQAAGVRVTVVTGERAVAASKVAAGMLAPVTEISFTEQKLLCLNLASIEQYTDFVARVEDASGLPGGMRATPTLSVAYDADDAARLSTLSGFLDRLGLRSERLTSRECRAQEPLLSPSIRSGLLVEGDWSCDNRLLWAALVEAGRRQGVHEVAGFVHAVQTTAGCVRAVMLSDGTEIAGAQVVLANGAWASQISGTPDIPVRPVKGQILRLDPGRLPSPGLTVRAISKGTEVYLVPRTTGREVVVGATVEELGFDDTVTAGGVYELLRDARSVVPITAEYGLAEVSVGWRPATPDNAPILGPCDLEGLLLATGHYRNGVLLTPVTASAITELVLTGELPQVASEFTLSRFSRRTERVN